MKKRALFVAIAAAVLIITALLLRSYGSGKQSVAIVLPTPASQSVSEQSGPGESILAVTPETVCTALSTLSRMESYSRSYSVTTFWNGGSSVDALSVWQKGDSLRMSLDHAGTQKNLLISGRDLYVWYEGVSGSDKFSYYKDFDYADADRFARLLTYEELYDIPTSDILDAGYVLWQNEPCIYVKYEGYNNYVNQIYVSNSTGLLMSAEIYDGETLIYSMQSNTTELSTPEDDVFTPPGS